MAPSQDDVASRVRQCLFDIDHNLPLDDAIVDYLAGIISTDDAPLAADIAQVTIGFLPELEDRFEQLESSLAAVIDAIAQVKKAREAEEERKRRAEAKKRLRDSLNKENVDVTPDLRCLQELSPQTPLAVLAFLFREKFNGDKERVALFLVEEGDKEARQLYEDYQEEKKRQEEKERREWEEKQEALAPMKNKIVGRYADQVDEQRVHRPVVSWQTAPKRQERYHNNRVVSTTGQKVIIENLKEEWDGGSRGRVKTKGKRGKGWI